MLIFFPQNIFLVHLLITGYKYYVYLSLINTRISFESVLLSKSLFLSDSQFVHTNTQRENDLGGEERHILPSLESPGSTCVRL